MLDLLSEEAGPAVLGFSYLPVSGNSTNTRNARLIRITMVCIVVARNPLEIVKEVDLIVCRCQERDQQLGGKNSFN